MDEMTLEFTLQDATEEQQRTFEKLQTAIENDADFVAANTLEEAYEALKKYIKMTMEQFKAGYEALKEKVTGLFEEVQAKRELSDEELDIVAGGGLGSWFKKNWKSVAKGVALTGLAIVAGGVIGGAVVGMVATMAGAAAVADGAVLAASVIGGVGTVIASVGGSALLMGAFYERIGLKV